MTTAGESKPIPARKNGAAPREKRERPLHLRVNSALRWLHTYLSMFSLMAVLLFSVTGVTLNHPDWTFGSVRKEREAKGALPKEWLGPDAESHKLEIAEQLRKEHRLRGSVTDFSINDAEVSFSFKTAGYSADGFVNREDGSYQMTVASEGLVSVINDLHRGKNTGPIWGWVIDLSGYFLILVSLTGVGMLLYLKKTRASALWSSAVGLVVVAVIIWYIV